MYELGQFDECIAIEKDMDNQNTNTLKGQYCLAQISIERDAITTNLFDDLGAKRQLKKQARLKGSDARLLPTQAKELDQIIFHNEAMMSFNFFFFK